MLAAQLSRRAGQGQERHDRRERYLEALGVVLGIDETTLMSGDDVAAHAFSPGDHSHSRGGVCPHSVHTLGA